MKHFFFSLFFLCLALLPIGVQAESVLRSGDKITIAAEETVVDNYYVWVGLLGTTVMSGTVGGDMYGVAGSMVVNGTVKGDLGVAAGIANLDAVIEDDARVLAGEVIIEDSIGGDLFVAGGIVKILSTARIDGDVFVYGGELEMTGEIGGSVYGTVERVRIDAPIGGDVSMTVGTLTLGSKADIAGDVSYESASELVRAQEATVAGAIQQIARDYVEPSESRDVFIRMIVTLFASLSLYVLFKKEMLGIVRTIEASYARAGVIGLATLVSGPVVALLLIFTMVGALLGLFALGLSLLLMVCGYVMASVITGLLIVRLFMRQAEVNVLALLIGAIVFQGVSVVPYMGPLIVFILLCIAVGGVTVHLYRRVV